MKLPPIAVDFDGTICAHEWPEIGSPYPYAKEALHWFKKQGHQIGIYTSRPESEHDIINAWLTKHDIPFDFFYPPKPIYLVSICDRTINMNHEWEGVIRDFKQMEPLLVKNTKGWNK